MNVVTKKYLKAFEWRDYVVVVIGLALYSVGLTGFLIPNKIVTGGLGGISLLFRYATGVPVWVPFLVINSCLLVVAWIILGKKFVFNTLFGSLGLTLFLAIAEKYITQSLISADPLIVSIIGAVCCGTGLGMIYSVNSTTGGTDIVGAIVTKYRYISMGRALMFVDIFIILSSWFLFKSLETIIYGLIIIAVLYYTVDMVISGARQSVQFFIFSTKYEEIAAHINSELHRGCTIVDGVGSYTKQPQHVLIVLARKTESTSIFRLVKRIDRDAFISQSNVVGVYGKGFDQIK